MLHILVTHDSFTKTINENELSPTDDYYFNEFVEYSKFNEFVDEFITTLPQLLEALETLINIAIDHDVEDAMSMYQQYQPLLVPNSVGPVPQNNIVPSFTEGAHKRGRGRHRSKQNSLSIKLTPAYYDHETHTKLCKLSAPPLPSRS